MNTRSAASNNMIDWHEEMEIVKFC